MTYDKVVGEGPYTLKCRDDDRPYIFGPSLPENGWSPFEWRFLNTCDKLNAAYAEGRKSAEKDFKELLKMADSMCDKMEAEFYYTARQFYAWKKARGD